jgi:hypothetical protein
VTEPHHLLQVQILLDLCYQVHKDGLAQVFHTNPDTPINGADAAAASALAAAAAASLLVNGFRGVLGLHA